MGEKASLKMAAVSNDDAPEPEHVVLVMGRPSCEVKSWREL